MQLERPPESELMKTTEHSSKRNLQHAIAIKNHLKDDTESVWLRQKCSRNRNVTNSIKSRNLLRLLLESHTHYWRRQAQFIKVKISH